MAKSLPGPLGYPVVGSLFSLIDFKERTLFEWAKTYGNVFEVKMGSWSTLVINGYDEIREALVDNDGVFSDRPIMQLSDVYRSNRGRSEGLLFTPDHEKCRKWKETFVGFIDQVWTSINDKINNEGDELVKFIKNKNTKSIDLRPVLAKSAANVLLQVFFSKRLPYENEELEDLIDMVYNTTRDKRFGLMVFMPWLKFIPTMRRYQQEVKSRHNDCVIHFRKLLHQRLIDLEDEEARFSEEQECRVNDLASVFKKAFPEMKEEDTSYFLTITEDSFFGGTLPTRSQFLWVLLLLLQNPEYVSKCQKEIDSVLGKHGDKLSDDHFSDLHLTRAVVEEGIRLRHSVPTANFHCVNRDAEFRGFKVRKNMMVVPNLWSVHHDPDYWRPDPESFRPERHLNENGHFRPSGHVLPFSIGRRRCAGRRIAMREILVYLVKILRNFDASLDGQPLDKDGVSVALNFPHPYTVKFESRF